MIASSISTRRAFPVPKEHGSIFLYDLLQNFTINNCSSKRVSYSIGDDTDRLKCEEALVRATGGVGQVAELRGGAAGLLQAPIAAGEVSAAH